VVAKDRITLQTFEPLVIGMIFPSQIACALYMRDKLAPLIELMRGRPELTPFATPAAIIEPLDMILHIFPIDGELPALVPATDPQQIGEVLRETLPESIDGTFEIERCRVQLIDYARRYRSVLRYQVEGRRPGASRNEHRLVYGKVFDDTLGALTGPVTAALREGLVGGRGYQFNVPRVLGWRADMRLALLEAIPGEPVISDMLKARLRGRPTPSGAASLEEMITTCAKIAVTLHNSGVKLGRRRTFDDELASLRQGFADMRRYSPELAERLEGWTDQISTYAEQSDSLPLSFCHGDFTYTQVIFAGQQAGLVDFDAVCQAESALDLGHFMAYLAIASVKAQKLAGGAPNTLVDELRDRFLRTYIAEMGGRIDDVERLRVRVAVYQMASLLRRALRSWQKFKGSRLENALALIEEEMACLPQLDY
jgi:aminoglycoside phosphotransferase (APT) family kinase protein